ncbi:hypothetical protein KIPB_008806, partial [Kipferlia bialata]|eukprot:g8806.t1
MSQDKFTNKAMEAVSEAHRISKDREQSVVAPAHLALAIMSDEAGLGQSMVRRASGDIARLTKLI